MVCFFSLPISRAGGTRSCPVLPKFVARTGQTVDGISQSEFSTWFSLCILWLPCLLQGSIEGSTLPWRLKTSTSGRAFGGNFQDVSVTCSNLAEVTNPTWNLSPISMSICSTHAWLGRSEVSLNTNGEFSFFRFFWMASCTKKHSQKHINQQTTYCLMVPRSCTTWLKPLWIMG